MAHMPRIQTKTRTILLYDVFFLVGHRRVRAIVESMKPTPVFQRVSPFGFPMKAAEIRNAINPNTKPAICR